MAQLSDLMTTSPRRQPLHVVAEARGPLLEEFSERLKSLQKRRSATEHWQLLTTDVLPTEELVAGVIAQSGMQPEVSNVLRVCHACSQPRLPSLGKHPSIDQLASVQLVHDAQDWRACSCTTACVMKDIQLYDGSLHLFERLPWIWLGTQDSNYIGVLCN